MKCVACDVEIQAATGARTGGKCRPCKSRRDVHLTPDQQSILEETVERLSAAGWRDDFPSKRQWLDFETRLKGAIRKSRDRFWEALAICELPLIATKEPGLDVQLAVEALARSSGQVFAASSIRESAVEPLVAFTLAGTQFETTVTSDGSANAFNLLRSVNDALAVIASPYRFHPIASRSKHLLVTLARVSTIERSIAEGLLPVAVA